MRTLIESGLHSKKLSKTAMYFFLFAVLGTIPASANVTTEKVRRIAEVAPQQTVTVTGTVKDNEGNPIIGASVLEKGTNNGTITDINGHYSLSVKKQEECSCCIIYWLQDDGNTSRQG